VLNAAEFRQFRFFLHYARGSAETHLRCGGQCVMGFVAHLSKNRPTTVKEFWKSTNICQSYERRYSGTVFFDSLCTYSSLANHLWGYHHKLGAVFFGTKMEWLHFQVKGENLTSVGQKSKRLYNLLRVVSPSIMHQFKKNSSVSNFEKDVFIS